MNILSLIIILNGDEDIYSLLTFLLVIEIQIGCENLYW